MTYRRLVSTEDVPEPVRRAFEAAGNCGDPCRRLWLEVAAYATLDALGHTAEHDAAARDRCVREARRFFLWREYDSENSAEMTFDNAGVSLTVVMDAVRRSHPGYLIGGWRGRQHQDVEAGRRRPSRNR